MTVPTTSTAPTASVGGLHRDEEHDSLGELGFDQSTSDDFGKSVIGVDRFDTAEVVTPADADRDQGSLREYAKSLIDEFAESRLRARRIGNLIDEEAELVLTVLSFVQKRAISFGELIKMGPEDRLFRVLFDLYDLDLLTREGTVLRTSDEATRLLRRMGFEVTG